MSSEVHGTAIQCEVHCPICKRLYDYGRTYGRDCGCCCKECHDEFSRRWSHYVLGKPCPPLATKEAK